MVKVAGNTSYADEELNLITLFTSNDVINIKLGLQLQSGLKFESIKNLLLSTFCSKCIGKNARESNAYTLVKAYVGGYLPDKCFDLLAQDIHFILRQKIIYAHENVNLQLFKKLSKFIIQHNNACMKTVGDIVYIDEMFIYGHSNLIEFIKLDNVHANLLTIHCLSIKILSIPNVVAVRIHSKLFTDVFDNLDTEISNLFNAMHSLNNEFIELFLYFKTEDTLTHLSINWNCDKMVLFISSVLAVKTHVIKDCSSKIFLANPRLKEISYTDCGNIRETIYRNRLQ